MADRSRKTFHSRYDPYPKTKPKSEFEILTKVQKQVGFRGHLVMVHTLFQGETSYTRLQHATDYIGSSLQIVNTGETECITVAASTSYQCVYQLFIDGELIVGGAYGSESTAKRGLAELAIEELQKTCFTVIRKIHPRSSPLVEFTRPTTSTTKDDNINTFAIPGASTQLDSTPLSGGVGEKMMKLMGWSGGGLGAKEQGRTDLISSYIQIKREGLGSNNITQELHKILANYSASRSINSIAFSNDFSKEERSMIHQLARKKNLKSRSYGPPDDRVLVIQSKIRLMDLVATLLEAGGENEQYKLLLPTNFQTS